MPEDQERLRRYKALIRFFLNQANESLAQAKAQCPFVYPAWRTVEDKIRETKRLVEDILETSKEAD
jgi:hypothetical protein